MQMLLKIAEYPPSHILKQCTEFLLYVCKVVENIVIKSDKVNKKEFVTDLYKALFGLNDPESKLLSSSIDFLHSNNMISKIKNSKNYGPV